MHRIPNHARWITAAGFVLLVFMIGTQLGTGCVPNGARIRACVDAEAVVLAGCTVTLDASQSSDPDFDPITFTWTQTAGTQAVLSDPNDAAPFFMAPEVADTELLAFQLVVRDFRGGSDTCELSLRVLPAPEIITADRVCAGDVSLAISSVSHPDLTYQWTITGGTITSDPAAASITFTAGTGDTLELSLTVTSATQCSRTATRSVAISPLPVPVIAVVPEAVCALSTGNIASTPTNAGSTYAWTITGGTITAGADTNQITYTAGAGTAVDLTVTETTADGCIGTAPRSVPINPLPAPVITANPEPVCVGSTGNTASVPVNAGSTYAWTITGGTITVGADTNEITYTAGEGATVELTVTETTAAGCPGTATRSVPTQEAPAPVINSAATVCASSTGNTASTPQSAGSTYVWTITGGTITSGANTSAITYTAGGGPTVELTLTETTAEGCIATATRTVQVTANPAPSITADNAVCADSVGNVASTVANAGSTYTWSITGGVITAGQNSSAITYTAGAGANVTLTVTETTAGGCSSSASRIVTVNPLPAPAIVANPDPVCDFTGGNIATTPLNAGSTYVWAIVGGSITAGQGTNEITYTSGGGPEVELSVTETTADGCEATAQLDVPVNICIP